MILIAHSPNFKGLKLKNNCYHQKDQLICLPNQPESFPFFYSGF